MSVYGEHDLVFCSKAMRQPRIVTVGHGQPQLEFGPFGKVYHEAARYALAQLRRKKVVDGNDVCPMIFLYRHSVELYLKSIVIVSRTVFLLSGRPEPQLSGDLYKTHRLDHLLTTVTTILKSLGIRPQSPVAGVGSYADLRKIIGELSKMDERSYAFRYPVNTTGAASVPRGTILDIEGFGSLLDAVLSFLAQCNRFLESRWDAMVAAHSKAESEGREGQWPEVDLSCFNPR